MSKAYKISEAKVKSYKLEEPALAYGASPLRLIKAAREGLSRVEFTAFAKRIGRSIASLETVIPASYSTLTKKTRYDLDTSERIIELSQIFHFGHTVFGDYNRLNLWLDEPSHGLGGLQPFSLLDTSFGIQMVRDQMGRLAHGIAI